MSSKRSRNDKGEVVGTIGETDKARAALEADRMQRVERVRVALDAILQRERCRIDIAVTLTNAGNEFRLIVNPVD